MRKVIILSFPCFLILLEAILRKSLGLDSQAFMGPCLSTAGIGILIGLIEPRQPKLGLSAELTAELRDLKIKLRDSRDDKIIDIALLLVFLMILTWCWTMYLSAQATITTWWVLPNFLVIGLSNYFVAVILAIVKEVI